MPPFGFGRKEEYSPLPQIKTDKEDFRRNLKVCHTLNPNAIHCLIILRQEKIIIIYHDSFSSIYVSMIIV
jgi:hypothetical protein